MDAWTLELTVGDLLLDISILGALLLLGTVLRRQVRFFQRYMVPNSLIAGFMGLFLGSELFNVLPLDPERMGAYVYHLLAVTFIGIGLYPTSSRHTTGAVHLGFMQVSIMLIQGIVGVGIALAATWLVLPDLNPAMGCCSRWASPWGPELHTLSVSPGRHSDTKTVVMLVFPLPPLVSWSPISSECIS